MKRVVQGGISILLAIAMIAMNLWPVGGITAQEGENQVEIIPITKTETVYAAAPTAAPTPVPTDKFVIVNQTSGQNVSGTMIDFSGDKISLAIRPSGTEGMPADAKLEWLPYNESIIKLSQTPDKPFMTELTAVGPGYTAIRAQITIDKEIYFVDCQVHVPLELEEMASGATSVNPSFTIQKPGVEEGTFKDEYRGMRRTVLTSEKPDGPIKKAYLQLSGPEQKVSDDYAYTTYLAKLKYVPYEANAKYDTTPTIKTDGTLDGTNITNNPPALEWTTSDPEIATVNEFGVISAQGAGYAEITATTQTFGTSDKGAKVTDSITISVLVVPTARLSSTAEDSIMVTRDTTLVKDKTFTLITNAKNAENIIWKLRRGGSESGTEISMKDNPYMKVEISDHSGAITFSDVQAGVYYLTGRVADFLPEGNNNHSYLQYKIIVPIFIKTDPIIMNVGDTYNILQNSNLPINTLYNYSIGKATNIIEVTSKGILTALAEGTAIVDLTYRSDNDIFEGIDWDSDDENSLNLGKDLKIPVTVIDDISLNHTSAVIYVAGTMQLILNASNPYATVKWESSDPSVATVDEDGLVTGVKVGDCEITATQVINGVTKTATCQVKVKQSVTKITLDPSSASLGVGDYLTINATVDPKGNGTSLHWISSDNSIITITDSGNLSATVQAVAGGIATITALNKDNGIVGSCLIKVHKPITGITLSETSVTIPLASKKFQLFARITPAEAEDQEVVWKSTDTSVIDVDQNGNVTLKKDGTAAIIVTSKANATITAICNVIVTKSVSGIALDTKIKNMYVGETFRMTYVISPVDLKGAAVTWTTTNNAVAAVDSSGLITAKGVGTAVIIAKTADGGHMDLCTVNVSRTATAVKLDLTKLIMNVGESYLFETTLTPADSDETGLAWESSDPKVATISKRGKVTGKAPGTAVIMVKTKSGSTGYCTVVVLRSATGIEISSKEESIYIDDKLELEATVLPEDASDTSVTWSSSNPEVAYVNDKGEVKGLQAGVAIITCTAVDGGFFDYCVVTVEELVTEITLNETEYRLGVGRTFRLIPTITGNRATNKKVEWSSSNPKVVSVDENGRMKGLKVGSATITCTATDGSGAEAYCLVEVVKLVSDITLNETYVTLIQGKSVALKATVTPKTASYPAPVWSSDNTKVAIVNKKGVVTGLTAGNCIITAAADDSSGVNAICYVKVIEPVASTNITVQESEVVMSPGETKTVGISIVPSNSTDTYTWSSDNTVVASVNEKTGKITAKAVGSANITVMTESGRRATIKVLVVGLSRTYVELQQYTSLKLKLEVDGANSAGATIRWDVDNQEVAEVANGVITARAIGTTTVYAVVNGRRLACTVKVVKIK